MTPAHLHSARCRRGRGRRRRGRGRSRAQRPHARDVAIEIVRTGSRGLYWLEPMVEVATPAGRIAFGPVTPADVRRAARRAARRTARIRCGSASTEEIPWLKRQTRLTFARCGIIDPLSLDDYRAHGGYKGLRARADAEPGRHHRRRRRSPACAAAAAPASRPASSGDRGASRRATQKYIVCNADEGDSGTFADRMLMEGDPFVLIEGMTIAGIAVGATKGYIYIRSEYPHAIAAMNAAIAAARRAGMLGDSICRLRPSPSTSRCGSAPAPMSAARKPRCWKASRASAAWCAPSRRCRRIKGLFGKPTVINNVLSLRGGAVHPRRRRAGLCGLRHGPLARHDADPARRQHQARRPVRDRLRHHARRTGRRHRRRHAQRPAGARGAGRRPARRLFPARAVRHAVRLRGLRRAQTG